MKRKMAPAKVSFSCDLCWLCVSLGSCVSISCINYKLTFILLIFGDYFSSSFISSFSEFQRLSSNDERFNALLFWVYIFNAQSVNFGTMSHIHLLLRSFIVVGTIDGLLASIVGLLSVFHCGLLS